jgi:hypothetical protein
MCSYFDARTRLALTVASALLLLGFSEAVAATSSFAPQRRVGYTSGDQGSLPSRRTEIVMSMFFIRNT